ATKGIDQRTGVRVAARGGSTVPGGVRGGASAAATGANAGPLGLGHGVAEGPLVSASASATSSITTQTSSGPPALVAPLADHTSRTHSSAHLIRPPASAFRHRNAEDLWQERRIRSAGIASAVVGSRGGGHGTADDAEAEPRPGGAQQAELYAEDDTEIE